MSDNLPSAQVMSGLARGDYRLLTKVCVDDLPLVEANEAETQIAAVVDVETSGLDPDEDAITELAIRRFRFDEQGRLVKLDKCYSWLEDPGRPLSEDVVKITGITDDMVRGQSIDDDQATKLLRSASVVISHNAAFDRPFVDRRLPAANGLPWACSCEGIDWKTFGFNGRALGWLLAQRGWFHEAHRAVADVDALITLLAEEVCSGQTFLEALVRRAEQPSWIVRAVGAHFDVKDKLRARGYRWDAKAKVWFREVLEEDLEEEQVWLLIQIYAAEFWPRAAAAELERVTWTTRYSGPPRPSL
jgi:DNA polymerase-3 subunit epsilon